MLQEVFLLFLNLRGLQCTFGGAHIQRGIYTEGLIFDMRLPFNLRNKFEVFFIGLHLVELFFSKNNS